MVKFGFWSSLARSNESQDGGQFIFLGYMSLFFQPHHGSILLVDSSFLAIIQHMYVVIGTIWVCFILWEQTLEKYVFKYRHLKELKEYMNLAMQEANAIWRRKTRIQKQTWNQ